MKKKGIMMNKLLTGLLLSYFTIGIAHAQTFPGLENDPNNPENAISVQLPDYNDTTSPPGTIDAKRIVNKDGSLGAQIPLENPQDQTTQLADAPKPHHMNRSHRNKKNKDIEGAVSNTLAKIVNTATDLAGIASIAGGPAAVAAASLLPKINENAVKAQTDVEQTMLLKNAAINKANNVVNSINLNSNPVVSSNAVSSNAISSTPVQSGTPDSIPVSSYGRF